MIQAIGLTSAPRRGAPPAVADLTFDLRPGEVTGLLGPARSGKTTALRLLLGLQAGRGATLVDGCPLPELARPAHAIGAVVGDLPGHPRRTARGHLRMLCAAFGLPVSRAEEVLRLVGLDAVADRRLGTYSLGMDRRLGFAAALLARPRSLLLDDPARGLPPREAAWVHDLVRRHAAGGGAVLLTGRDPRALARTADRVLVLDQGRLVADEPAEHFARTRLRPCVAVRSPYAGRLAELLTGDGAEVLAAGGSRIAVYGPSSAEVGEIAYRHGILLHHLADQPAGPAEQPRGEDETTPQPTPPPAPRRAPRRTGPLQPLRYELRRAFGVRTPWPCAAAALLGSAVSAFLMTRTGAAPASPLRLLSGWATDLPLPAAAVGAGALGALGYGQEFRYRALAPGYGPEPRSPRLLVAKLAVCAATAVLLAVLAGAVDLAVVHLSLGPDRLPHSAATPAAVAAWAALAVGCAWAGLLAACAFRTTALGIAAVLAVPLAVAPAVRSLLGGRATRELTDAGGALWSLLSGVPQGEAGTVSRAIRFAAQPTVLALSLSLTALACGYLASALLGRLQGRRSTALRARRAAPITSKKG